MYKSGVLGLLFFVFVVSSNGQRITTIQLDGVQYFVSRMNPYSPELNYFLAYQYCRSLGLQLASFETKEKADSITQYLSNAGYNKYDFWTSGNKLGTDMFLWMSTGLPFNATFNYMRKATDSTDETMHIPSGSTSPQRTARESDSGASNGCVALKAPAFEWDTDDCMAVKDFICEQTRCYYYNYGSIPVSSAQGRPVITSTTTVRPYTSSPATSKEDSKYTHLGINDFISKLRSTAAPAAADESKDDVNAHAAVLPHGNGDIETEQSTNGPYDSFHGVELQDDPAALVDHSHHHQQHHHGSDDDYVSTIEPETVTIYERSFQTVL